MCESTWNRRFRSRCPRKPIPSPRPSRTPLQEPQRRRHCLRQEHAAGPPKPEFLFPITFHHFGSHHMYRWLSPRSLYHRGADDHRPGASFLLCPATGPRQVSTYSRVASFRARAPRAASRFGTSTSSRRTWQIGCTASAAPQQPNVLSLWTWQTATRFLLRPAFGQTRLCRHPRNPDQNAAQQASLFPRRRQSCCKSLQISADPIFSAEESLYFP
jgi:hypothetical protein